jgi:hypothetical protein
MAFQVSPGVQVNELDLTNIVPATATTIGGCAGTFRWGPVEDLQSVGSEKELAEQLGAPNTATSASFLTAASFLKYGGQLKVARVVGANALNATSGNSSSLQGLLIKNRSVYEATYESGFADRGVFGAKYPGVIGNSLKVEVCSASSATFNTWTYRTEFNSAPGTSEYANKYGSTNDELHIVVLDEDGLFTGTKGSVLERFANVSQASDAVLPDGTSNYYRNVINTSSKYIWWLDHPVAAGQTNVLTKAGESASQTANAFDFETTILQYSLGGGADGDNPTSGNIVDGLDTFADSETVDVNLVFSAIPDTNGSKTISDKLITLASARKDIVVFLSPPLADTVSTIDPLTDVLQWVNSTDTTGIPSTSYAVIDSTALKVYDKYNDGYVWIPAAGHMAGLCANADIVADPWFSPAGLNRGQLLGVTKLAFNPKQAARDALYKARVNPIVSFPGQGILLYGDKTAQSKPSAFDRINVRRLFITLEKSIATAAKYQLFEFNDEFTRAMFRNMVEPFLREVQGRRGITDFAVICDETNNTADIVDRNEFRADIYVKPARSINFITLNFVATRTGVEFSELVGK